MFQMSQTKRRYTLGMIVCVFILLMVMITPTAMAEEESKSEREPAPALDLAPEAKSAVLMDVDTGQILFEKNSDQPLPPASITKIMTMLLVMEAIEEGKIDWQDMVRTSERAASMGGSQIFLEVGEEMTVEDMMKGVAVASGNDATVALAEFIAGSEDHFITMMNEKAKQLGMDATTFVNTNGLPADNHYTSAKDIAIMSRELMKYEEDITRFTGIYEDYLREGSDSPFWLVNTNRMIKFYRGVDGLKTGYTSEAKYCLAATATRNDMRVVSVVMGTPSPKARNAHTSSMLDYAFQQYQLHPVYENGEELGLVQIDKGQSTHTSLISPRRISILTKKGEQLDQYEISVEEKKDLSAPLEQGDIVGRVIVKKDGEVDSTFDLLATQDVSRASLLQIISRNTLKLFRIPKE